MTGNTLRRLRQASLPLVILIGGVAIAAYFIGSRPRALPQPPVERVWPVAVIAAERQDVRPDIRVYGEVRAGREAEIRALVAGRLVALNPDFRDGALIRSGTELAVIDPVDYEIGLAQQRAELERVAAELAELRRELDFERQLLANAEQQVELAARGLARQTELARTGRDSRKARDDAEAALASAEQNALLRRQAIARHETRIDQQTAQHAKVQAMLASAERDLAHTRVLAPFDGHAADVRLALGQRIAVGESLGRLLDIDALEARFEVPEADYARLLALENGHGGPIGREVEVVWRLGEEARRFAARVTRVGAEIDAAMGGIELFAELEAEATAAGLRAGAFVAVQIPGALYEDVLRLPSSAVSDAGRLYVIEDERLTEVEVEVVRRLGDELLLRAEVADGAPIVARQFPGIGPGLKARAL